MQSNLPEIPPVSGQQPLRLNVPGYLVPVYATQ